MDKRKIKKQFCVHGHDTFANGRDKRGHCNICQRVMDNCKRKKTRDKIRKFLDTLKIKPCFDCNKSYPPYVMDFDHRPGEVKSFEINKFANVSSMKIENLNLLYKEIDKCDLVCANCHRERTHKRQYKA
jgi:hypothetical protein